MIYPLSSVYILKKDLFEIREVQIFIALLEHIVDANSLKIFKNQLGKYWQNQPALYDNYSGSIRGKHIRQAVCAFH